ncbi:uncharacterized protein PV09_04366 [Verruconis gallopava]|uniref:DUF1772 domain-containing protein n=1 Tax=Verruconis gallopava TaxID=253628 RepID=A0A0D2AZU3_9PEZI|nr:uncharacterized protein PV09_04366 [Verruconis gallopava]KIW04619.1 hypothetical protein PV09_04366 [Verruconis gallopava]
MAAFINPAFRNAVLATCIAIDYTLAGNAITQSYMGVPALIHEFPSSNSPEYAVRARLLGKQWPPIWVVGNNFFRPISTIATIGYAFTAWSLARVERVLDMDWRWFAFNAALHATVIVHSAVNMQPLNNKLAALAGVGSDGKGNAKVDKQDEGRAVEIATNWIEGNKYRLLIPVVTGAISLWQVFSS